MDHPQGLDHEGTQTLGSRRPGGSRRSRRVGRPRKKPIGSYVYFKRRAAHFDVCRVDVYVLAFAKQLKTWREKGQREAKWFGLKEAADLVEEPGLIALLEKLDAHGLGKTKPKKIGSASR